MLSRTSNKPPGAAVGYLGPGVGGKDISRAALNKPVQPWYLLTIFRVFSHRLISLSLEQQCFRQPADEEGAMSSFTAEPVAVKSSGNCCSLQPLTETYNLVEEVYVNRDQCHTELQVLDESPEDGIVVAVDIGTTYTGYAYSFRRSGRVSIMRKPECNDNILVIICRVN